jgi:steroid delta-isomerase-like uncharacterized protein
MAGVVAAMNARDAKKLASFYAETAVVNVIGAPETKGRDQLVQHFQQMFTAFPDFKTAANRVWMKDDVAIVEWVMNGTHKGEMHGIKATEKPVGMQGVSVVWSNGDGQIKEEHVYHDMGTVMSQMGLSKQKARGIPTMPGSPQVFSPTGSPDETKNLEASKAWMKSFETKKEADFVAGVADSIEWDDMTQAETMKGKEAGKKYFKGMLTAFPDLKASNTNSWAIGEYVIHEGVFEGTHKGNLFGMIPPTNKKVAMHGLDIVQYKDGKVVKGWSYGNSAEMMTQLGLMPQPGDKKADPKAATPAKPADPKAGTPATPATPAKPAEKK